MSSGNNTTQSADQHSQQSQALSTSRAASRPSRDPPHSHHACQLATDERGTAEGIGYILSLGVFLLLATTGFIAASNVFLSTADDSQTEGTAVTAEQVADGLIEVDQAARASNSTVNGEFGQTLDLPDTLSTSSYRITLEDTTRGVRITITTGDDVGTSITRPLELSVQETTVPGGPIRIQKQPGETTLSIRPA